jgi:hypothetical protein
MGQDTFVYDLKGNEGRDMIMDFSQQDDILEFAGVADRNNNGLDIHDLDAMVKKFAANDDGSLRVDFKVGTSITFATLHYDNQTSMTDLVNNNDHIVVA